MHEFKYDCFYDPIEHKNIYSISEIISDESEVHITSIIQKDYPCGEKLTHLGFEEVPDTRDEYEAWKDSYFYQYIRPLSLKSIPIKISSNIKKIFLPSTITNIGYLAFGNANGIYIEIDPENKCYESINGSIVNKKTNDIIYKYEENK